MVFYFRLDSAGEGYRPVASSCEHDAGALGFIKGVGTS
jgi:hypothetical protein